MTTRRIIGTFLPALLAGLVLAGVPGTAEAAGARYPVKDAPLLTHNPLYKGGVFKQVACEEPEIEDSRASVKRYTLAIVRCLDRVWSAELRRRGLAFRKPVVRFVSEKGRACGKKWPEDTIAIYCRSERSLNFPIGSDLLDDESDLFLLTVVAHEYAHHVQSLSGITKGNQRLAYRNKKELNEQYRRQELQAECLTGVFTGSVWESLARTAGDWRLLLASQRMTGDDYVEGGVRDHGKGANIVYWMDRGFRAVSPSACNTWTAASARVA
ncbi:neutral zinc metallopeptidase [Planomonospora sp. ID67723]|uniref:neutral zinc metallopeptidase n=1 Tax=Planomonospora sp. ID67723 TaxID=2738134 RepID=UPI0018C432D9|nr:neutral zinc metallopeptidase [Planomonospora sp. ID67723]MBG0828260.1 neutral zinc metallopeptidase [Planomonospora sp. ID67723]